MGVLFLFRWRYEEMKQKRQRAPKNLRRQYKMIFKLDQNKQIKNVRDRQLKLTRLGCGHKGKLNNLPF
jgi:hypothetical protein